MIITFRTSRQPRTIDLKYLMLVMYFNICHVKVEIVESEMPPRSYLFQSSFVASSYSPSCINFQRETVKAILILWHSDLSLLWWIMVLQSSLNLKICFYFPLTWTLVPVMMHYLAVGNPNWVIPLTHPYLGQSVLHMDGHTFVWDC